MNRFFNTRKTSGIIFASVMSFLLVVLVTQAASTISTNISTGGTLTVTGASTFTGVATFNGSVHASSTLLVTDVARHYETVVLSNSSAASTAATGGIYFDTDDSLIKVYDGTNWVNVATSTGGSGIVVSGSRMQLDSLSSYFTFGTTTQQGLNTLASGLSMMTLEGTSTKAVPLTLVAYDLATANTFQVKNSASTTLFYINAAGALFGSSTAQFTGALTTYGSDVLGDAVGDTLTVNSGTVAMGNLATTTIQDNKVNSWSIATSTSITPSFTINTNTDDANARIGINTISPNTTFEVVGTASSTNLVVGGNSTNGTLAGMIHGVCTFGNKTIAATTTVGVQCTATGVRTNDKVFVTATSSLHSNFIITSASSTAANTIGLYIFNTGAAGTTTTSGVDNITAINFFAIR